MPAQRALRLAAPEDGRLELSAAEPIQWLEAAAGDEKKPPRFSMTAYSGGAVRLNSWDDPVVIDLAGLTTHGATTPILRGHDPNRLVGHADDVDIGQRTLKVNGLVSGGGPDAAEVTAAAKRGFPWRVSIGAYAQKREEIAADATGQANGRTFRGPVTIVRASTLAEVSFTPIPADPDTSARVAATQANGAHTMPPEIRAALITAGLITDAATEDQAAAALADHYQGQPVPTDTPAVLASLALAAAAPPAAPEPTPEPTPAPVAAAAPPADLTAAMRTEAAAEIERQNRVAELCADRHPTIRAEAVREGWTEAQTELAILRAERPTAPAIHTAGGADATPAVLEASLSLSYGHTEETVLADLGEQAVEAARQPGNRGLTLQGLIRASIALEGGFAPPTIDNDAIRAAFSTVTMPNILTGVARRTLLASFTRVPAVAEQICATTDLVDFKTHNRYRMTVAGEMEAVGPSGELQHASLGEEGYTQTLGTYGKMITLNRQTIINDDLGAFLQIPAVLGRKAAIAREKAVFTTLLAGASAFFTAGRGNYIEGASTVLSITSLGTATAALENMTDSNSEPLIITPAFLLVPPALRMTAEQIFTSSVLNETTTANKAKPTDNPWRGSFQPVVSPYVSNSGLTGYSATQWFLLADPADIAAVELAYLRGMRTPTIEQGTTDFNVLGQSWRAYWDFGVALADYYAGVHSKGAA